MGLASAGRRIVVQCSAVAGVCLGMQDFAGALLRAGLRLLGGVALNLASLCHSAGMRCRELPMLCNAQLFRGRASWRVAAQRRCCVLDCWGDGVVRVAGLRNADAMQSPAEPCQRKAMPCDAEPC